MSNSQKFWNGRSANYDRAISNHDAQYEQRLDQMRQLLKPSDNVLDCGCATGEIALDLAPYVNTIEGIDVADVMIKRATEKAQQRSVQNASFLTGDIFDPRLEPESYDAILAFNILHLVHERDETLFRIKQLLRPGGMLFVETPCMREASFPLRAAIKIAGVVGLAPYAHFYRYGEPEAELKAHQFNILGAGTDPENDFRVSIAAQKPMK